jgi:hypothetical protein
MKDKSTKLWTSFRISHHGSELIATLAEKLGINKTAVVEQAVRKLAEREGVKAAPKRAEKNSGEGA